MIQNASNILKSQKQKTNDKELASLVYRIKCLEEKLSVESDFGYGNDRIINYENKITEQLQFILNAISDIPSDFSIQTIQLLNTSIDNVNTLLYKRTELKTR